MAVIARMLLLGLCSFLWSVDAHGAINRPSPRQNYMNMSIDEDPGCAGSACWWYSIGCINGCKCTGLGSPGSYLSPEDVKCKTPMEPTLNDPTKRTFNMEGKSGMGDWTKYNPWRAPGYSIPLDACGMAGARPAYVRKGPLLPERRPKNVHVGFPGSKLPPRLEATWQAGSTVKVWFSMWANHGGGYQYRLCPTSKDPKNECFEEMPLEFASATQTIHWEDHSKDDVSIPAVDVAEGTKPAGSTWRRNPVPSCNCDYGFTCPSLAQTKLKDDADVSKVQHLDDTPYESQPLPDWCQKDERCSGNCKHGFQFDPPAEGVFGQSPESGKFSIGDLVQVPAVEGDFVLQWRWDCEQTPQIWSSCADIRIGGDGIVAV